MLGGLTAQKFGEGIGFTRLGNLLGALGAQGAINNLTSASSTTAYVAGGVLSGANLGLSSYTAYSLTKKIAENRGVTESNAKKVAIVAGTLTAMWVASQIVYSETGGPKAASVFAGWCVDKMISHLIRDVGYNLTEGLGFVAVKENGRSLDTNYAVEFSNIATYGVAAELINGKAVDDFIQTLPPDQRQNLYSVSKPGELPPILAKRVELSMWPEGVERAVRELAKVIAAQFNSEEFHVELQYKPWLEKHGFDEGLRKGFVTTLSEIWKNASARYSMNVVTQGLTIAAASREAISKELALYLLAGGQTLAKLRRPLLDAAETPKQDQSNIGEPLGSIRQGSLRLSSSSGSDLMGDIPERMERHPLPREFAPETPLASGISYYPSEDNKGAEASSSTSEKRTSDAGPETQEVRNEIADATYEIFVVGPGSSLHSEKSNSKSTIQKSDSARQEMQEEINPSSLEAAIEAGKKHRGMPQSIKNSSCKVSVNRDSTIKLFASNREAGHIKVTVTDQVATVSKIKINVQNESSENGLASLLVKSAYCFAELGGAERIKLGMTDTGDSLWQKLGISQVAISLDKAKIQFGETYPKISLELSTPPKQSKGKKQKY